MFSTFRACAGASRRAGGGAAGQGRAPRRPTPRRNRAERTGDSDLTGISNLVFLGAIGPLLSLKLVPVAAVMIVALYQYDLYTKSAAPGLRKARTVGAAPTGRAAVRDVCLSQHLETCIRLASSIRAHGSRQWQPCSHRYRAFGSPIPAALTNHRLLRAAGCGFLRPSASNYCIAICS